jgi:DNA-binding NtrC family response regulator
MRQSSGEQNKSQSMPRILVIDDDETVRDAMKTAFEAEGFEVETAENGGPGIQAIEAAQVDAVIVNIWPDMDGLEAIGAVRKRNRTVPVIAVSGAMTAWGYRGSPEPPPGYLAMAAKLGEFTALNRPMRPAELVEAVKNSIELAAGV